MTSDFETLAAHARANDAIRDYRQLREQIAALLGAPELAEPGVDLIEPLRSATTSSPSYPTEWAYERACAALHRHRERAEQAEAELAQWRATFGETACRDVLAELTELRELRRQVIDLLDRGIPAFLLASRRRRLADIARHLGLTVDRADDTYWRVSR